MNIVQTYKGRDDNFFSGKVLKFVQAQIYFFAVRLLISFFFEVQFISFIKGKSNSTIEQQKCKGHEQFNRILQLI